MLHMTGFRMLRRARILQRCCCGLILSVPLTFALFTMFCSNFLHKLVISDLCYNYRQNQSTGTLCKEFCSEPSSFSNFDCIDGISRAFTAERNGNVYEFNFATIFDEDLSWKDNYGRDVYVTSEELYNLLNIHLKFDYNTTLKESVLKRIINQGVDENQPNQIIEFWSLINDHNYLMAKLFEKQAILPTVLGTCGSMYATEHLNDLLIRRMGHTIDLTVNFGVLYEYVLRLDMIKPDPVKICRFSLSGFGVTANSRIKAMNANYMILESQLHKLLASGKSCSLDAHCNWYDCKGVCMQGKCVDAPRVDNVQMLCNFAERSFDLYYYFRSRPRMLQYLERKCKRKYLPTLRKAN